MQKTWKPAVVLMLVTPILTELTTGATPIQAMVLTPAYLFCATVGYGFPVLLLRELAVRRGLALLGMLPLGLAYGLVNEGLMAKTLFLAHHVPIDAYDGYGFVGGIEIPWALTICTWHAVLSFTLPIILVESLFPAARGKPWLAWSAIVAFGGCTVLVGCAMYFRFPPGHPGSVGHLVAISLAFGALLLVSDRLPKQPRVIDGGDFSCRQVWRGVGLFALALVVPVLVVGLKTPAILMVAGELMLWSAAYRALSRRSQVSTATAVAIAYGVYLCQALAGLLTAAGRSWVAQMAAEALIVTVFAALILRAARTRAPRHRPAVN